VKLSPALAAAYHRCLFLAKLDAADHASSHLLKVKMNVTINDLMVDQVMTTTPHQTISHVRQVMRDNSVSCMPVVDSNGEPVGIVTSTDLLQDHPDGKPISQIIGDKVFTVPRYGDVSLAARMMRNHKIHHVVVTDEKKVVGLVSSYDLLKLVENHRFVMKNAPTIPKKGGGKRRKDEVLGSSDDDHA
jgi:CBS domain-containing protein